MLKRVRFTNFKSWASLDMGCGPCGITDLLSERVESGGRVVGLDKDEQFLEYARAHAVTQIFVGHNQRRTWRSRLGGTPIDRLIRDAEGIDLRVFPQ